jgi:hypothetical protein
MTAATLIIAIMINWTTEISQLFAINQIHVMKLYHNCTTTKTQELDCGINLESRQKTAQLQEVLIAAAVFKNAYLDVDM